MASYKLQPIQCKVCGSFDVVRNDDNHQLFTCQSCEAKLYLNPDTSEQNTIDELMLQLHDYAYRCDAAALVGIATRLKTQLPKNYLVEFYYQLSANRLSEQGDDRQFRYFLSNPFITPTKDDIKTILPVLFRFARISDFDEILKLLEGGRVLGTDGRRISTFVKDVKNHKEDFIEKIKKDHARYPRDIFICHANELDTVASALAAELEHKGLSCWYDHRNLPDTTQDDYVQRIHEQIAYCKVFVLIAKSVANITKSVETELLWAQEREHTQAPVFKVGYFLSNSNQKNSVWEHVTVKHAFSMESSHHYPEMANIFFSSMNDVIKAVESRYIFCNQHDYKTNAINSSMLEQNLPKPKKMEQKKAPKAMLMVSLAMLLVVATAFLLRYVIVNNLTAEMPVTSSTLANTITLSTPLFNEPTSMSTSTHRIAATPTATLPVNASTIVINSMASNNEDTFATPSNGSVPAQVTGYFITLGDVPLREVISAYAKITAILPRDTVVYVASQLFNENSTWYITYYGEYSGYVRADQLRQLNTNEVKAHIARFSMPTPALSSTPQPYDPSAVSSYGYVRSSTVNLRATPSTTGSKLKILRQYAFALIIGSKSVNGIIWYNVNQSGTIGWIDGRYTKVLNLMELSSFLNSSQYLMKCTPCQVQNLLSGSSSATSCDIMPSLCR